MPPLRGWGQAYKSSSIDIGPLRGQDFKPANRELQKSHLPAGDRTAIQRRRRHMSIEPPALQLPSPGGATCLVIPIPHRN